MSLDAEKQALRTVAERRRDEAFSPSAAFEVAKQLPLERMSRGAIVAGTVAMRSELDPLPSLERLASSRGVALALPRTPTRGLPLVFHSWAIGAPLEPGTFGVREPFATAPIVEPNVLLVPLLAFDLHGARLGYGGGFYDRTLAQLRSRGSVLAIGLAFEAQRIDSVPTGPHDERLDAVVTEAGVRWFR